MMNDMDIPCETVVVHVPLTGNNIQLAQLAIQCLAKITQLLQVKGESVQSVMYLSRLKLAQFLQNNFPQIQKVFE
jgi:hypothetical protein